jgi:hypothetical protein
MTTPPTTDDTKAMAREIRDKINALAPAPVEAGMPAPDVARYLAAQAQVNWSRFVASVRRDAPDLRVSSLISAQFAAAYALLAFHRVAPQEADEIAAQIVEAWNMGETDEWSWDALGADAAEIARLADDLVAAEAGVSQ